MRLLIQAALTASVVALVPASAQAITPQFTVNNTNDQGAGSLRQAIMDSNSATPGPNQINFAIGTGPQTISVGPTPLPDITTPVAINGYTQPGYQGVPLIRLDGASAGDGANGLTVKGGSSTVDGLEITGFSGAGVLLQTAGQDQVIASYVGTDGTMALPNGTGIKVTSGSNTIGGTITGENNLISGNTLYGVQVIGSGASSNQVANDLIGTDLAGASSLGNGIDGVWIGGGATDNTVGGSSEIARVVVSGNSGDGLILVGRGTSGNLVQGSYFGLNAAGDTALGNDGAGVAIFGGATGNTVGGIGSAVANVISGNLHNGGVAINGHGTSANKVQGNQIGTTADGTAAVPNGGAGGVEVYGGATGNTVGGSVAGTRNLISGNTGAGVALVNSGTTGNTVEGNFVGTNPSGTAALPNAQGGVSIYSGAAKNLVGGTAAQVRNLISGNGASGVFLSSSGTTGNVVEGNFIGTNVTGKAPLANNGDGVLIVGQATGNRIGGPTVAAHNLISGNAVDGVGLHDTGVSGNVVEGNWIGTNATKSAALPNHRDGVFVRLGATGNTIGGTTAATGNTIAYNRAYGVQVDGSATHGNRVERNLIFLNHTKIGIALTNKGNAGQPAPVITRIQNSAHATKVFLRVPAGKYRVELFVNPSCADPEGRSYLVATHLSGGAWSLTLSSKLPAGQGVTATATNASTGNTSRFSACKSVP